MENSDKAWRLGSWYQSGEFVELVPRKQLLSLELVVSFGPIERQIYYKLEDTRLVGDLLEPINKIFTYELVLFVNVL